MKRLRNRLILALILLVPLYVAWPTIAPLVPIVIVLLLFVFLYRRTS